MKLLDRVLYSISPRRAQARLLRHSQGVPFSYYKGYLETCRKAAVDDVAFANFKSDKHYIKVLEQPQEYFGAACLNRIVKKYEAVLPKLPWDTLCKNDQIGNPSMFDQGKIARGRLPLRDFRFSSTTLRYIYYALEMISHAQRVCGKASITILEIGGGYGGQCLILRSIAPVFDLEIRSYTIVDLEEPCQLQERYLTTFGLSDVRCVRAPSASRDLADQTYDLLVANYSLGELPRDLQDHHVEHVVPRAKHGFMLWNLTPLHPKFNRDQFPLLRITREIPRTGPSITVTY